MSSEDAVVLSSDSELSKTSVDPLSIQSNANELMADSQMVEKEEISDSDSDIFPSSQLNKTSCKKRKIDLGETSNGLVPTEDF